MVSAIDAHSLFVVIVKVVARPTHHVVCEALLEAMRRYRMPSEVLSDKEKQVTGGFTKPLLVEVTFERVRRENGIVQRCDETGVADDDVKGRAVAPHPA